jgi:tRNA pseudouridine55 synthase
MDGVLVIDKPAGPTSHDVVARVRRVLKSAGVARQAIRVGHTGTLDPLATGVLPLVVGRATRLASLLSAGVKDYDAQIRFGAATPTYDAESVGTAGPPSPPALTVERIAAELEAFRGSYEQSPPPFSAKKTGGVAAYKLARRNQTVVPRPVTVTAHEVRILDYAEGVARIQISCSSGFYVRSLAHDLGQRLGCGAYLEALRRTRAGDFSLTDAVGLEVLYGDNPDALERMIPMGRLLTDLPSVVLLAPGVRRAGHGNALSREDFAEEGVQVESGVEPVEARRFRLLDESGALLGIAEARPGGLLHPVIVLV